MNQQELDTHMNFLLNNHTTSKAFVSMTLDKNEQVHFIPGGNLKDLLFLKEALNNFCQEMLAGRIKSEQKLTIVKDQ